MLLQLQNNNYPERVYNSSLLILSSELLKKGSTLKLKFKILENINKLNLRLVVNDKNAVHGENNMGLSENNIVVFNNTVGPIISYEKVATLDDRIIN